MKFHTVIMNPPFSSGRIHHKMIKAMKTVCKKMVVIIPSKEGDIPLSKFSGTIAEGKLKIYSFDTSKPLNLLMWTKQPQSQFSISVPRCAFLLTKFYQTGEYGSTRGDYISFSFHTKNDLDVFRKRLYQRGWNTRAGFLPPNYEDILTGTNYIKKYRQI